ncbi:MAG: hypothetical protein Kow0092_32970 [Deferrisomatales bacterium]
MALAILGSSFFVLLSAHAAALRREAAARRLLTGTLLARELLARTEVDGPPELGGDSGEFGEAFPGYTWERQVETVALPGGMVAGGAADRLREVRLRVAWPERGGTRFTEVVYYAFVEEP